MVTIFANIRKIVAFTLAEVLITLLIIGAVASLVIPALINDTQNQEFAVLLKKDFGTLSSACKSMMMNNGGNLAGLFNNENDIVNKFGNYIIFNKKCSIGTGGCFHSGTNTWKNFHGNDAWFNPVATGSSAVLSNGGLILFEFERKDCEESWGSNGSPAEHICGWTVVDINGFKGPNVIGKDIFAMIIAKTGLYPFGIPNNGGYSNWASYCNKDNAAAASGMSCAAVILSGQKISY